MKAAVLVTPGEPLWLTDDVEIPDLAVGQVLVKIRYTGVCHSQLMEVSGLRGEDPWLPHLLGHEATGVVVAVGQNVSKVKEGDHVVLSWIKGGGLEAPGAQYRHGNTIINSGAVTTFSEYSVVSENRCTKLPTEMPMDIGSLLGCAVLTGAGAVNNCLKPDAGKSIAIFGLGGIGLSALMAAKLKKLDPIIAIDVSAKKLALAAELGATHTVNGAEMDPVEYITQTWPGGVDCSIDASGLASVIEQAFNSVRRDGGRCVFASHPAKGDYIRLDPFELICGKHIRGTWGGESVPDRDIPRLSAQYLRGDLPLGRLITHRYPLADINQAISDLQAKKVTRALIEMPAN